MSVPNIIVKVKYSMYGDTDLSRRRDFYSSSRKDDYMGYIDKGATNKTNHDLIDFDEHVVQPIKTIHPKDYMDYVGNYEKTKGVFSKDGFLTSKEKKEIREFLRTTNLQYGICLYL